MLAEASPASFVAWDLLALGDEDLRDVPSSDRRARLETVSAARRHRSTCRPPPWIVRPPPTGSTDSRGPGWMASSPSASMASTSRASGRCSRSSTSAPPTASSPGSAGTRTGRGRTSDRCCSACSTTRANSTTSASHRRSPGIGGPHSPTELQPLREGALDGPSLGRMGRVGECRRRRCLGSAPARGRLTLEPRQGPLVGAAAHRAGGRGGLRPPPGRPLPPRRRPSSAGARTSRPAECRYDQLEETRALPAGVDLRGVGMELKPAPGSGAGRESGVLG